MDGGVDADLLLVVCWASAAYMPVALGLYIKHRNHPSIKYRQPHLMALECVLCMLQCWGTPVMGLYGGAWACVVGIAPSLLLFRVTGLVYMLAQGSVVAMFAITELLALPQQRSPTALKRMQAYRWLLFRPVQALVVVMGGVLAIGIGLLILPKPLWTLTYDTCSVEPAVETLFITTAVECAVLGVSSLYLSRHVSKVVDNFGLRQTYWRAAVAMLVVAMTGGAVMAATNMQGRDAVAFRAVLHSVAAHVVVVCHIVLPVRRRLANNNWVTRTVAIQPLSSLHSMAAPLQSIKHSMHLLPSLKATTAIKTDHQPSLTKNASYTKLSRVSPAKLSHSPSYDSSRRLPPAKDIHALLDDLTLFLATPLGFDAVLAFAQKEAHTQELLAWAMVEKYKRNLVTAQTVYNQCLEPQSLLWCKAATDIGPAVARILRAPAPLLHVYPPTPASSSSMRHVMDDFSAKLVKTIYFKVLPGFQQHSPAWQEFQTTLKTMDLLESVDKMTQQTSSTANNLSKVSKAEQPLPNFRGNALQHHSEWSQYGNSTSVAPCNKPTESFRKSEISQTITR
ncbi:hypothetical protein H257_16468 [Aphanomyces astaci]|uniref:RGS domain-containing protein n=2 Tax=Aphanomyces astaci TaxID=112090 RepID=W4FIP2_APHAT|nr:hypothetical protein H257_16468 [Aphanomyces astaci]ETV67387.1 hypothetical protein H257_16468 [Aphanomyces astaci]|eukprot:XP_009843202.1 hypothetical protein H257_16468 [Aphanomyces astaci]